MKERLVDEATKQLQLTTVMVARRPETTACAGSVLVIERGRIVQELRPPAQVVAATPMAPLAELA